MSQPIVPISANLGQLPAEIFGIIGSKLSILDLARLSRVDRRTRGIVIKILIDRLQLDLPSQIPIKDLGLTLKITVLHLREFFKGYPPRPNSEAFVALPQILGFTPDLGERKITMDAILPLRSLELLRFALQQGREYHHNFADFKGDENLFLLAARGRSLALGHQRMALETLLHQTDKNYLNYNSKEAQLKYLCAAYSSGERSLVDYVEARISVPDLKHLYGNSSAELLSSACTLEGIEYIIKQLPSSFVLTANLIEHTYSHLSSEIFDRILSLRGKTPPAEILKGLYLTKFLPTLEAKRTELHLQPHPLELYFACLTMDVTFVQYAIGKIGKSHSDEGKNKASEHLCKNFSLPLIELLIKNDLFLLSGKFTLANLGALFTNAKDQNQTAQLLDLIDSMGNQNAYIVSSTHYITANEQRLYFACLTGEPQVVQTLVSKNQQHSPEVKARASAYLCQHFDLPLLTLLMNNKLFLLDPANASANIEDLFRSAKAQNKTSELLNLIDSMENNAVIVNSRFYIEAKYPYYSFFKSILNHPWSQRILILCANFWNFLRSFIR